MAQAVGVQEEVELWCGVYGNGRSFPITISINSKFTVNNLRIVIANTYNSLFGDQVYPGNLILYFTRKMNENGTWSNEWLVDIDEKLEDWLKKGRQADYPKMVPGFKLQDKYLKDSELSDQNIHILVEFEQQSNLTTPAQEISSGLSLLQREPDDFKLVLQRTRPTYSTSVSRFL
ncbi:hypothetical protein THRCLA_21266 [Thraustotheca clavata]|uniref:Crinkler effector protein N-terminal domain-containing protein n=1 Tax=Thraustotheca clavata TaxID=74557 RepID=A0A1V9ZYB4_9STRA|nr:hypothetical protein THRCLA_21266 [Thraustotheca clavata]